METAMSVAFAKAIGMQGAMSSAVTAYMSAIYEQAIQAVKAGNAAQAKRETAEDVWLTEFYDRLFQRAFVDKHTAPFLRAVAENMKDGDRSPTGQSARISDVAVPPSVEENQSFRVQQDQTADVPSTETQASEDDQRFAVNNDHKGRVSSDAPASSGKDLSFHVSNDHARAVLPEEPSSCSGDQPDAVHMDSATDVPLQKSPSSGKDLPRHVSNDPSAFVLPEEPYQPAPRPRPKPSRKLLGLASRDIPTNIKETRFRNSKLQLRSPVGFGLKMLEQARTPFGNAVKAEVIRWNIQERCRIVMQQQALLPPDARLPDVISADEFSEICISAKEQFQDTPLFRIPLSLKAK